MHGNSNGAGLSQDRGRVHFGREQPFWGSIGATWRQLAGSVTKAGFSFEWHEWETADPVPWHGSFHPETVEICLNLEGSAWVSANGSRMVFGPETSGFFAVGNRPLSAERLGNQRHCFLSVECSVVFLERHLGDEVTQLHPVVRRCIESRASDQGLSSVVPMTHRHRDLLKSLLRPPVLRAAQRLWYESKALEFAAEFFFAAAHEETLCTRAQRLAGERVARTKALLGETLAENLSLEELGRRVGCSPFYLSRTFSRETGLTISQWIRRERLERAAAFLRSGKYNVTEAALAVGYSSLSHFSEAFHSQFGCCPGLYPLKTASQRPATPERKSDS